MHFNKLEASATNNLSLIIIIWSDNVFILFKQVERSRQRVPEIIGIVLAFIAVLVILLSIVYCVRKRSYNMKSQRNSLDVSIESYRINKRKYCFPSIKSNFQLSLHFESRTLWKRKKFPKEFWIQNTCKTVSDCKTRNFN